MTYQQVRQGRQDKSGVSREKRPVQRLAQEPPLPEKQGYPYQRYFYQQVPQAAYVPGREQSDYPPASPHSAGHYSGLHPEDRPFLTSELVHPADLEPVSHTTIRRYPKPGTMMRQGDVDIEFREEILQTPIKARRSTHQTQAGQRHTEEAAAVPTAKSRRHISPLLYLGIGMIAMLGLVVLGINLYSWWQQHQEYANYGYPSTWQTDAVVGHNGDSRANPSHFLFLNLHGHPEVIEIPAGDETKQKTYLLPQLVTDGFDTLPVTGEFTDVNGDGKPDMIIKIQDQRLVFINTGTGFRPLKPGEKVTLPQN